MQENEIITGERTTQTERETALPEITVSESEGVKEQEFTAPAADITADRDRNSYFADMRRKQENEALKAEISRLKADMENHNPVTAGRLLNMKDRQLEDIRRALEVYEKREVERVIESDLMRIQAIDPTVTSIEDVPQEYLALRFNNAFPMDAATAFRALQAMGLQGRKPPSTGSLSGVGGAEKEFFTGEELNRLTKQQLSDPQVMAKAMRSMALLK